MTTSPSFAHTYQNDDDAMLSGVTVLDISQGLAGPYCGLLLRQQGARVIKVEPPHGDWSRQMGRQKHGHTGLSIAANIGKESVMLDTRTVEGRAALHTLAKSADVIVQNFRPGVAVRMGLDPQELAQHKPQQVYISISGYGSTGAMAQRPALDTTVQAFSGLMQMNADASGQPRRIGIALADLCTGLYAAQCATSALFKAARGGRGRHIELSMLQACAALQAYLVVDDVLFSGVSGVFNAPTGIFATQDGLLYISMVNDAMFQRLAKALAFDDWLQDDALKTSAGRIPRAAEMTTRLGQTLANQTMAYWEQFLTEHDILFAPVRHPRDMVDDAQSLALDLFQRTPSTCAFPDLPLPRIPGQNAGRASEAALHPPMLGEHTDAVLREFGIRLNP